jgi:protein TonB
MTLSMAIIVHAIVVLGVTFAPEDVIKPRFDSMEIILVQQHSNQPEEADFLAQASLEGGGDVEEEINPTTPMPAPFPETVPEITAPEPLEAQPPESANPPVPDKPVEESKPIPAEIIEQLVLEKVTAEDPLPVETENPVKTKEQPKTLDKAESEQAKPDEKISETAVNEQLATPPTPSATTLLTNSFKIASLSAEIRHKLEAKSKRPKRKFISASTKEYKYASYMEAWRAKVERVGNLNYPEAARKQNLSGSLILDVALNADGSINQITIRRSSGQNVLDDAAIRIVELASPFAPFPEQVREETDILHITRTWQFLDKKGFR